MCFLDGHCVKDVRQRDVDKKADALYERRLGESAIEDMCCAEGKEPVLVVVRGCRDDRRETGQFGELDRCVQEEVVIWIGRDGFAGGVPC